MFKFGSKNFGKRRREGEGEGEEEHLFIQDNCVSFRKETAINADPAIKNSKR